MQDDDLAFRFVTDRFSLALTATVGERWNRGIERLRTPGDLRRWCVESGLLTTGPTVRAADLEPTRVLREAVYRSAVACVAGRAPSTADRGTINDFAARDPLVPVLTAHGRDWAPASRTVPAVLSTLARDAVDLLGGPDRARLRECASETCGLLFIDTSRPGSRRWCSSDRCGGAARAMRYRRSRGA